MKPFTWHQMQEHICIRNGCWGVNIAGDQFDYFGMGNVDTPMWNFFTGRVQELFPKAEACDIMSSVINEDLMTFDSEEDAMKLYRIMESDMLIDKVYAILYGPEGSITENT